LAGLIVLLAVSRRFRWFFFNVVLISLLQSGGSRGGGGFSGRGGSSGSGGFSGGGGSSGGGGASGSW
jgi:uncharacterized protein